MTTATPTTTKTDRIMRQGLKPGHGYYFGASTSPTYVLALTVTDDVVVYIETSTLRRGTAPRWVAEDLAARAGVTVRQLADDATARKDRFAGARAAHAAAHGLAAQPADFDRLRVRAAPVNGTASTHWSAAERHGNVGFEEDEGVFTIELRRRALAALQADAAFEVRAIETIALCPTAGA